MAVDTGSVASLYPHVIPLARHGEHIGRWPSQRLLGPTHFAGLGHFAALRRSRMAGCHFNQCGFEVSHQLQVNVTNTIIEALEDAGVC